MKSAILATTVLGLSVALSSGTSAVVQDKAAVVANYADIAAAIYGDALTTAQHLQTAVKAFVADPSAEKLQDARTAWLASRGPYQQTEVFRFGNAIVDDWEGKVNAWPLDEGLIDYVDAAYGGPPDENEPAVLNVVANPSFTLSGTTIDASNITPEFLAETLREADASNQTSPQVTTLSNFCFGVRT